MEKIKIFMFKFLSILEILLDITKSVVIIFLSALLISVYSTIAYVNAGSFTLFIGYFLLTIFVSCIYFYLLYLKWKTKKNIKLYVFLTIVDYLSFLFYSVFVYSQIIDPVLGSAFMYYFLVKN